MIAKAILFSYITIGIMVAIYYLSLCFRYWTSQYLIESLIARYGEEEGYRLLEEFTQPSKIIIRVIYSLFLWPTVIKGYFEK